MGSQPLLLRGTDCVRLGLIEIGGNTNLTWNLSEEEWRKVEILIRKSSHLSQL